MENFQKFDSSLFSKHAISPEQMGKIFGGEMNSTADTGAGSRTVEGTSTVIAWAADDAATKVHTCIAVTGSDTGAGSGGAVVHYGNPFGNPHLETLNNSHVVYVTSSGVVPRMVADISSKTQAETIANRQY